MLLNKSSIPLIASFLFLASCDRGDDSTPADPLPSPQPGPLSNQVSGDGGTANTIQSDDEPPSAPELPEPSDDETCAAYAEFSPECAIAHDRSRARINSSVEPNRIIFVDANEAREVIITEGELPAAYEGEVWRISVPAHLADGLDEPGSSRTIDFTSAETDATIDVLRRAVDCDPLRCASRCPYVGYPVRRGLELENGVGHIRRLGDGSLALSFELGVNVQSCMSGIGGQTTVGSLAIAIDSPVLAEP